MVCWGIVGLGDRVSCIREEVEGFRIRRLEGMF